MFKFLTAVAVLIVSTSAFPQQPNPDATATVLSNTYSDDAAGNFNYEFEISNGIKSQASGQLKDINVPVIDENGQQTGQQPGKGEVQTGSFSYTAPDGQIINVQWIADENGFQPKGDHLPVAPTASPQQ